MAEQAPLFFQPTCIGTRTVPVVSAIAKRMNRSVRGFDHAFGEREREHSVYARTILMFSPTRGCADTVWTLVVRVYSKTSILDHGGISLEVNDPDSMTHGCGKN